MVPRHGPSVGQNTGWRCIQDQLFTQCQESTDSKVWASRLVDTLKLSMGQSMRRAHCNFEI